MSELLPITITPTEILIEQLPNLTAVVNKLEAQFMFHTLTAGWYGDEDNILNISLVLVTAAEFSRLQTQSRPGKRYDFADDVISHHHGEANEVSCFIALTGKELTLLTERSSLLERYLQTKIYKVLNLIAEQENLHRL